MSKVLIITPVFCNGKNRRFPLLLQSIYWIRQQSYRDYMHIVVDDGSMDHTLEALRQMARNDPRMQVLSQDNSGSSAAINAGIKSALSTCNPAYVTICHSDDILTPDSLEVRIKLAQESGAAFVYSDEVTVFDTDRRPRYRKAVMYEKAAELAGALLRHQGIPYSTMMWDAAFFQQHVEGYDARLTSAEDWDIAIRSAQALVASGTSHATADRATMLRREHQNGLYAQNLRDGTKERCYEVILGKHFAGDALREAMDRERNTRLKQPAALERALQRLYGLMGPDVLKKFHHAAQWVLPHKEDMPDYALAFLRQWREIDYEDRPGPVSGKR